MTQKYLCRTKFDITATGIKNNFNANRIPMKDRTGVAINNLSDWNRARNKQRNFDTILQVISLRSLPESISDPVFQKDIALWEFTFEVPTGSNFEFNGNPTGLLELDCEDVPMIIGLDELPNAGRTLEIDNNIFFTRL